MTVPLVKLYSWQDDLYVLATHSVVVAALLQSVASEVPSCPGSFTTLEALRRLIASRSGQMANSSMSVVQCRE